jgi:hypothetical protein
VSEVVDDHGLPATPVAVAPALALISNSVSLDLFVGLSVKNSFCCAGHAESSRRGQTVARNKQGPDTTTAALMT